MRKLALAVAIVSLGAVALIATAIAKNGNGGGRSFHATLSGFEEVPSNSTTARGSFRARLKSATEVEFRLTYRDLEGALTPAVGQPAGAIGQAHIHLGQRHTNGGISVTLCGGTTKPACPATNPATVEGTFTVADVTGPSAQGIDPAEASRFAELIRAMRHGATYVNIHTSKFPAGEARGQVNNGRHHGRGRGKDD